MTVARRVVHEGLQSAARIPVIRGLVYGAEAFRYWLRHGGTPPLVGFLGDYAAWRRSQARRETPLEQGLPWLTFGAIHFLETRMRRNMRVFEYGSGGSTLFFGLRAESVVSVEHDVVWSAEVRQAAGALHLKNCTILDIAPTDDPALLNSDPANPDAYASSDANFEGKSFRAYAAAIDTYRDESFDLILIDGRARPSCFKHALTKLALGGILMLDNSERVHYAYIKNTLDDLSWKRHDFAGAGPFNKYFWTTTAWDRPE